jgi:RNA polymerase sigma-70 factor (ECF subfamily)
VRNRSLDHLRRRVHSEDVAQMAEYLPDAHTPNVLDELDAADNGELLWRPVDVLPPCQADLIRRAFVSGQTHAEIAAATGLPLGTVKSRIRLGLDKLRCAIRTDKLGTVEC